MKSNQIIKSCYWEITKRCNLECLHCISSVGNKKNLDEENSLKIIDILKDWHCEEINLTGGEPLIRNDIFNILKRAKKRKIKTRVLSNGTLINNKNIYQIKSYVDDLGISLDGSSAEFNDKIRGGGSFEKIIKSINLIKKNKIPITLYITICELNLYNFEKILKLVKLLKIDNIRINEVNLKGRAYKNRGQLKINSNHQFKLKYYLLNILKKNNYTDRNFLFNNSCEVSNDNIFLSPLGYIYSCIEVYQQKPSYHLGNILKIDKNYLREQMINQAKLKPKKCPYQIIINDGVALCINNQLTKCNYGK
ncbi:MAG: hypothetical protein PWQ56_422 [Patescibacteria group bacterium]|nr:hypothetical protein [Patescibacteria group bacterium]